MNESSNKGTLLQWISTKVTFLCSISYKSIVKFYDKIWELQNDHVIFKSGL